MNKFNLRARLKKYKLFRFFKKQYDILRILFDWIYLTILVRYIPSKHVRIILLRIYGCKIASNVSIYNGIYLWKGKLSIGEGTSIGFRNHLDCRKGIEIGKNVCFATEVMIWTLHHDYNDVSFKTRGGKVRIGDYAWLCARSVILPGVSVGEGAVVAAGAVVCSDVEPWTVVGGVPAKKIGMRENKEYNYRPSEFWIPFF